MTKVKEKTNCGLGKIFFSRKGVSGLRKSFCGVKYPLLPFFTL